MILQQQRRISY